MVLFKYYGGGEVGYFEVPKSFVVEESKAESSDLSKHAKNNVYTYICTCTCRVSYGGGRGDIPPSLSFPHVAVLDYCRTQLNNLFLI